MLATTIDGVIARLATIIDAAIANDDRRGYFAALYNRVTLAIRAGIAAGAFEDGPRMERLDVVFANRYLAAYDAYESGAPVSASWRLAFDAAKNHDLLVLQHLLLGMNAHISLDLGIAAATVAPGADIASLLRDFDRINDVLGSLVGTVENELVSTAREWNAHLAALYTRLEGASHGLERSAVKVLMDGARSAAWHFATGLARDETVDEHALNQRIAEQDARTALAAKAVLVSAPVVELVLRFGGRHVADDIRLLAQGEQLG